MTDESKVNVLLVDDRPENLLVMRSVLDAADQNLVCVSSGRQALKFLLNEDVALILLDVQMPGLNGFELAELIRERERTQHTPIIFISATSVDEHYVFEGYSLGAVDYLTKPISPEILKSKVGFFTRLFRQNREILRQASLLEEANAELDRINGELELRVQRRTAELRQANRKLEKQIAARRQSEARLAIEHSITRTLSHAESLEAAAGEILTTFCEKVEASFSALWLLDEVAGTLVCEKTAVCDDNPATSSLQAQSLAMRPRRGIGLPGQVWSEARPVWLNGNYQGEKYPRAATAALAGLKTAIGFPLMIGDEFLGVIELFTATPLREQKALLNMFAAVGSEIGQFVRRKRIEAERESLLLREKSLRQQAETANRMKDEFLATVSHELRTPLNSILGWGQILNSSELEPAERKSALDAIYRNARSQSQLIDDLLDTSRLISGNVHLELSPTPVRPLIDAAVEVVRPAAMGKNIEVLTEFSADCGEITCDSRRLQQIVWNLLTNAVKFTPPDGRVFVECRRADFNLLIEVRDTGVGIDPKFLPHVFDRFRQADSSSTRVHDGLGLGLAIVRHLVELHGGSIKVESEGPGKGAAFIVSMPASASFKPAEAAVRSAPRKAGPRIADNRRLDGVRVMIVDDDADAAEMLHYALSISGAEVRTSGSVTDAFSLLAGWTPHVLLADINMPGEDGYSLIRRLRSHESAAAASIPAIALTAMARTEDSERAISSGFQMHMAKPVDIEELEQAVFQLVKHDQSVVF